jgi:predicted nucleic acid-binding protein
VALTPSTVLLDRSFLMALVDPGHPERAAAAATYAELLDCYQRNELRLRARADHLAATHPNGDTRRDPLFAPVETIDVAGQHRRAARRLRLPVAVDPDTAITLVLVRRERIGAIATFEPVLAAFDLVVLPGVPVDHCNPA